MRSRKYLFWFKKNLQGDIIKMYMDGKEDTRYINYTYDAWGNVTEEVSSGMNLYARYNFLRYRGYVYDSLTGLYYLGSRYYDPQTGRFINADGYVSTGTGLDGYNMFAYCNNNPIMMVDPNGNCPWTVNHVKKCIIGQEECEIRHNARDILLIKKDIEQIKSNFKIESEPAFSRVLHDNHRKYPNNVFHDQIFAVSGIMPSLDPLQNSYTLGLIDLYVTKSGWEWEHGSLHLLNLGHLSLGAGITEDYIGFSAFASAWSPSFSIIICDVTVEISFEVGAIGYVCNVTSKGATIKAAEAVGFGVSIH